MWFWIVGTGVCVWWAIETPAGGNRNFLIVLACVLATVGSIQGYLRLRERYLRLN